MNYSLTKLLGLLLVFGFWGKTMHAQPLPGQLIADPQNPARLFRKGQGSFLLVASDSPEDFLYRGPRNADGTREGDQMHIINRLAKSGMNGLYVMAIRSHGGDGAPDENPFNDPSDSGSGLNRKILDQWESWFTAMDEQGVVIYFVLYDDSAAPFGGVRRTISDNGEEAHFLQTLVNRFEHHKNLIWCIAEEYSEANSKANVRHLARLIREADDHDHVIAVHQLNGTRFDFPEDPTIDQFAMQINTAGNRAIHRSVSEAFQRARRKYNLNMTESDKHYNKDNPDREATRTYSWATVMGEAEVMVFFNTTPLNVPEEILHDQGRIADFFNRINPTNLVPRDDLLQKNDRVFLLANPGQKYVLYFGDGSPACLDLGDTYGKFKAQWYNPRTGERQAHKVVEGGATVRFETPAAGKDWVLLLQKIL